MVDLQQRLCGPEAQNLIQPDRTLLLEANIMLMDQQHRRLVCQELIPDMVTILDDPFVLVAVVSVGCADSP
jgi:hypothetical protein